MEQRNFLRGIFRPSAATVRHPSARLRAPRVRAKAERVRSGGGGWGPVVIGSMHMPSYDTMVLLAAAAVVHVGRVQLPSEGSIYNYLHEIFIVQ